MLRVIGGVLAASAAAPYLAAFFILLLDIFQGDAAWLKEPLDLLSFLVIGTFGLGLFGLPTLVMAAIVAPSLNALGLHSRASMITGGAAVGGLLLWLFTEIESWTFPFVGLLAGAICGWIYWRIALRGSGSSEPEEPT